MKFCHMIDKITLSAHRSNKLRCCRTSYSRFEGSLHRGFILNIILGITKSADLAFPTKWTSQLKWKSIPKYITSRKFSNFDPRPLHSARTILNSFSIKRKWHAPAGGWTFICRNHAICAKWFIARQREDDTPEKSDRNVVPFDKNKSKHDGY